MVPIEVSMTILWSIFGLVGMARRFPKELGATIGFTAMLLMLTVVGDRLGAGIFSLAAAGNPAADESLVKWFVYTGFIVMWVMFMYAGETFTFAGVWPPGRITGAIIDLIIGLLNGWIVVGTWWYYGEKLGYPMQKIGLFVPPASATAQRLVALTPLAILPDGQETRILAVLVVGLIALRVFR